MLGGTCRERGGLVFEEQLACQVFFVEMMGFREMWQTGLNLEDSSTNREQWRRISRSGEGLFCCSFIDRRGLDGV